MAGFNMFLAAGAGLAKGIEESQAAKTERQNKIDDTYRALALKTSFEEQHDKFKNDLAKQDANSFNSAIASKLQSDRQLDNNAATGAAHAQASAQNSQGVADSVPAVVAPVTPTPTNTGSPTAPDTLPPLQLAPQGGLNSPQGGIVPLQGATPTPATPQPSAGASPDGSSSLTPPEHQPNPTANNTPTTVYPNQQNDVISNWKGTPLTREDAAIIQGYANEANREGKGYYSNNPEAAIDVGFAKWKEQKAKETKSEAAWTGGQDEIDKANKLGVPYVQDKPWQKLDAKTQFNVKENDTKRLFGSQDEQRDIAKIPVLSNDLKTLYNLNDAISTGNAKALPGGIAAAAALDSYNALYNKITSSLAILSRAPGLGRMSVAELTADQNAFASLKIPNAANNSIILTKLAQAQRKAEEVDFQKQVLSANGHYDDGIMDQVWKSYDKANPVLDMSDPLNPKVLPYVSRARWVRGETKPDTDILTDTGGVSHGLGGGGKQEKPDTTPSVVKVDKDGNKSFDFSSF